MQIDAIDEHVREFSVICYRLIVTDCALASSG
jgi:hypothetical protein